MEKLLKDLRAEAKNGNLKYLTLNDVKELAGKRIQTIYFGYKGQDGVNDFVVSGVKSSFDIAKENKDFNGFPTQADYWASYMKEDQLNEYKNTLELLTEEGVNTFIRLHAGANVFTCSDVDRYVQFRVVNSI